MNDTLVPPTEEQRPWWENSEAIIFTAEWLVKSGRSAADVHNLYQFPWQHTLDYQQAEASLVQEIENAGH